MDRYTESKKYMKSIMGLCKWDATTYMRTNYKFSPIFADRTIGMITDKTDYFDKIFYVVEPDGAGLDNGIWYQTTTQQINHIHLLLSLSEDGRILAKKYGVEKLSGILRRSTGLSGKQIGDMQKVRSQTSIGNYFAKHLFNEDSHHNLFVCNASG